VLDIAIERAFPAKEVIGHKEQEYTYWHYRFGHISPQIISKLHLVVDNMAQAIKPIRDQPICEIYMLSKKI
jgi:hypothetical protein